MSDEKRTDSLHKMKDSKMKEELLEGIRKALDKIESGEIPEQKPELKEIDDDDDETFKVTHSHLLA